MDWLQKVLVINAPENTSLQAADWNLRGVFPWWVALVILIAGCAGVASSSGCRRERAVCCAAGRRESGFFPPECGE